MLDPVQYSHLLLKSVDDRSLAFEDVITQTAT